MDNKELEFKYDEIYTNDAHKKNLHSVLTHIRN